MKYIKLCFIGLIFIKSIMMVGQVPAQYLGCCSSCEGETDFLEETTCGNTSPLLYFNSNIDGICIEDDQMNSLYYSEMEFVKNYGPSQEGLPMTGSNRYYLRNFTIRGNETPMYEGFCSHNISADYARRTLNWPVVIEPGNLLDD